MDLKLEVLVLPVSDVDRAKAFYEGLGFHVDLDLTAADGLRVVHFTPPGSQTSIIIGDRITTAPAGSTQGLHLVVSDIAEARADLVARGVDVSELFHDAGAVFHHAGAEGRIVGPHPEREEYATFASFSDPDGNGWVLQEVRREQAV
ncbi:MAG: glyoxalase/bleomycin resistance protein/dioxygenase [Rhodoglobus sp.]|nr:glyoxalase/bleomycin resistance protein/dioxygenase [Rhodoglobus sp.]